MLVYGDPHLAIAAGEFVSELQKQVVGLASLDSARALLIGLGQLEQGIEDQAGTMPRRLRQLVRRATDSAAATFWRLFKEGPDDPVGKASSRDLADRIGVLAREAARLPVITIKVPEGFAFYSLYPEQYCEAAAKWLAQAGSGTRVAVVGIRSIGTTLSAVVAEVLRTAGCDAHRFTVRPSGPPFDRRARVGDWQLAGARFVLIVDEGPGLSGSSMAAVAKAVCDAGAARECISFLPAHVLPPGPFAPAPVLRWWEETPRHVTPIEEVRWRTGTLGETLRKETEEHFSSAVRLLHNVGGGEWRRFAYDKEAEWPAAFARFERAKFLAELSDGRRVLWKFAGLVPADCLRSRRAHERSVAGAIDRAEIQPVQALQRCHGFEMFPWIEGARLQADDIQGTFIEALARHVIAASEDPLSEQESAAAMSRLSEIAFCNTKECLGSEAAEAANAIAAVAQSCAQTMLGTYGDGRLAPCEFIRRADTIFKSDAGGGHDTDHTIIGRQSLLWDAAGAIVEWNMDTRKTREFVERLAAGAVSFEQELLRFYRLAYAAFRVGMATLSASTEGKPERQRLERAAGYYRAALENAIDRS